MFEKLKKIIFKSYSLDDLGQKYCTNKASINNCLKTYNYLNHYEKLFKNMKNQRFTLVEFGVHKGSSVQMWSEYFKKAQIIGVDKSLINLKNKRIQIIQRNILTETEELYSEIEKYFGSINIIIDDCIHSWKSQRMLFEKYFPLLNSKGIYIVEDVMFDKKGAIEIDDFEENSDKEISFTEYTKKLLEFLRYPYICREEWMLNDIFLTTKKADEIIYSIESIMYIPGAIIITKR